MRRTHALWLALALSILTLYSGCSSLHLARFIVKIDWVASPEYYGFYYAKAKGYYKDKGLAVTIQNGTGAPDVANELSAGTIYAGTTTSDNLLRAINRGGQFNITVPILMFNPCVLVVQQEEKSMDPAELRGKRIGVNKQASVYLQFQQLLSQKHIPETAFREIPVGWSGSELFQAHEIDGLLAYSTNAVVDLDAKGIRYKEFRFGDNELESYGLVLVINSEAAKVQGISEKEIGAFIEATLKGYADGANDLPGAVKAVRDEAPTLDPDKLLLAIKKISKLNSETRYPPDQIDNWVPGISKESRERFRTLLSRGNTHGH